MSEFVNFLRNEEKTSDASQIEYAFLTLTPDHLDVNMDKLDAEIDKFFS